MTLPKPTFRDALWLAAVIALLIMLKHCGNQGASTAKLLTDSLRQAERSARDTQAIQAFEYWNNMQMARFATKQAQDSSRTAWMKVSILIGQVRQKQAVLRVLVPSDTGRSEIVASCCDLAGQLADQVESLQAIDSLKDAGFNQQLTMATGMVDAQTKLLNEAHDRYDRLDSTYLEQEAAAKPRASFWGGVETQIGPISSAGLYLRYETPKGKEYGLAGGRQQVGWYMGVKVGLRLFGGRKK